jgi:hypothetical protein
VLVAIGIGMSLLIVVNTPALALTPLVAAERNRCDGRRLRRYTNAVGVVGTIGVLALAVPPGSSAVRAVFGLDSATGHAVSAFLAGLAPNSLGVALRRYQHGRLIHDHRTGPIVWATLVRLGSTCVVAWAGTDVLPQHGLLVAGVALSIGAFLEAAVLAMSRSRPAHPSGPAGSKGEVGTTVRLLAVHHGHLSAARLLVMAPATITIIGVAHAEQAPESLIVWPVLIQLTALFTSPTTDWESVAATALRENRRNPAPRRLTTWLAAAISAMFVVTIVAGPADVFVRGLLAVPDRPADLGLDWVWLLAPLPGVWIARAYLRGAVMAGGATRWLSVASLVHTLALVGVLLVLAATALPGVACAAVALVTGVMIEAAVTLHAARRHPAGHHA